MRKAVIPAAGLGTRFLPATKAIPKEMLPLVDKPVIQYVVEEAVRSGFSDVVFVTSQGKNAIQDHFDFDYRLERELQDRDKPELLKQVQELSAGISVSSVRQKLPLGLGHAVLVAEPVVGSEPFGVFLGDDIIVSEVPCIQQLINVHEEHGGSVVAVQEVPAENVSRFGVVSVEPAGGPGVYRVLDMVEKPTPGEAPSNLAIMGRYVLTPGIFEALRRTEPGSGGEIQLTDGLRLLSESETVFACRFEGKRYDAGNKLEYLIATVEFALRHPELGEAFRRYLEER